MTESDIDGEQLQAIAIADDAARQLEENDEQIVKCAVVLLTRVAIRKITTPESMDRFVDKFLAEFIKELEPGLTKKLTQYQTEGA